MLMFHTQHVADFMKGHAPTGWGRQITSKIHGTAVTRGIEDFSANVCPRVIVLLAPDLNLNVAV